MMKPTFMALLLAFLGCMPLQAQQAEAKQINTVKRNSQYLYAEATMKDPEEAREVAEELLSNYIDEYVAGRKKLSEAQNVIIKDVASKSEKIQMKRGEMTRVFVYVKKDDIIPAENTTVRVRLSEVPAVADSVEEAPRLTSVVEELDADEAGDEAEEPAAPAGPEPVVPSGPVASSPAQPAALPAQPVAQPTPAGDASLRLSAEWQQQVVDHLLACSSLTEARAYLSRMKAEYRVKRYGTADTCRKSADCFWLVGDQSGQVATVLGPGTTTRTNFRELAPDTLERHAGAQLIWFLLSK